MNRTIQLEPNDCYGVEFKDGTQIIYPRISRIIAESESQSSRDRLNKWKENNPEKAKEVLAKGTALHSCLEDYYGKNFNREALYVDNLIKPYWELLHPLLAQANNPIWVEGHREAAIPFLFSDPKSSCRYAGTPDLVATFRGLSTIIDLKTSSTPYHRYRPIIEDYTLFDDLNHPDRKWYFPQYYGWKRWQKVKLQLTAYSNMWSFLFKVSPEQLATWIAFVPDETKDTFDPSDEVNAKARPQLFVMNNKEKQSTQMKFSKILFEFYDRNIKYPTWEELIKAERPIQLVQLEI